MNTSPESSSVKFVWLAIASFIFAFASLAHAEKAKDGTKYKPIEDPPAGYEHDRWKTIPNDHVFEFKAFTTSFDGADDSDGDGDTEEDDKLGVPEWVAFEVRKKTSKIKAKRPGWMSEETLNTDSAGHIAPTDDSYLVKVPVKKKFPVNLTYNLSRGHMCPKNIANRLGENADHNTHTVLNACPQYQWHNNGIWKDLEELTENWADHHEKLWVICGPVFLNKRPQLWLGEEGEKSVAIPDGFFKIIVRESGNPKKPHVLAFLYPHAILPSDNRMKSGQFPHTKFLVSVDTIETHTGLDFFTVLTENQQRSIEMLPASSVWNDPGKFTLP